MSNDVVGKHKAKKLTSLRSVFPWETNRVKELWVLIEAWFNDNSNSCDWLNEPAEWRNCSHQSRRNRLQLCQTKLDAGIEQTIVAERGDFRQLKIFIKVILSGFKTRVSSFIIISCSSYNYILFVSWFHANFYGVLCGFFLVKISNFSSQKYFSDI